VPSDPWVFEMANSDTKRRQDLGIALVRDVGWMLHCNNAGRLTEAL
jgi:hypothetical protein